LEIARIARAKGPINREKLKQRYRQLLDAASRVVGQAKRFSREIAAGVKRFHDALKKLLPHLRTQIVKRSDQAKGFVVLPKR
jgi:IS5 family transposase